jgi:ActR/RegA family two-component response regulator
MENAARARLRLFIVDDDESLRQTLAKRFQQQGMTVTTAGSVAEALELAKSQSFDVALLDLHLPDGSGVELLGQLKTGQPEIEALMLTGHGSVETAIQALKLGAYDYLTKPFHFPDLEIHIQKAFEKVRLARRERQWVEQIRYESPRYRLIGSSPSMQRVVQLIEKVAPTDATVLVRGASASSGCLSNVACRSDEITQAMVIGTSNASRGVHDCIITATVRSANPNNQSKKSVAVPTRCGVNPRRKLQNVVANSLAETAGVASKEVEARKTRIAVPVNFSRWFAMESVFPHQRRHALG